MSYYTPPPYYYPTSLAQTAQPTTQTTTAYAAGSQASSAFPSLTKSSLESIIQHSGTQLLPDHQHPPPPPQSEPSSSSAAGGASSTVTTVDTPSTTAPAPSSDGSGRTVESSSLPPPAFYTRNPPTAPATPTGVVPPPMPLSASSTPVLAHHPLHHQHHQHRHSLPASSFTFSYPYASGAAPRMPSSQTTPSLASILDEPQPHHYQPPVKSPTLLHRSHSATASSRRRFYRPSPTLHHYAPTTADQDNVILAMTKQGKGWPEIASAVKMDVDSTRSRYTQLISAQPYYTTTNDPHQPRTTPGRPDEVEEVLWDRDDVETLRDLLEIGERAKWKFISAELTKDRNKRITSIACQKKFKDMFGVAESSSVLGSSLCYVVSPNGWSSLDAVPRRQFTANQPSSSSSSSGAYQGLPPPTTTMAHHTSSSTAGSKKPMPHLTP
ncbi:hypothetical protein TRVA0_012S01618 [Trichomonascus vanleenenianus]|uniref:uncharacterized protein n=1 Tax=Trichomonascus vanleenenianus TaxID=2268995 RepID=UPI003ECB75BE